MRVVVTGGAGFIGSALVRHLVGEAGAEVLVIDKLTYAGNLDSLASVAGRPNFRFFRADVTDTAQMAAALASFCPDQVIHLAAESHVDRSIAEASAFVQSNIIGTFSMLEAARAYWMGLSPLAKTNFRFVHVSTDEVYGSLGDFDQFYETTAYDPSSPYAASKAASDHLAMAWHRTYGLPVVISNCSNNYGPCQFPEKLIPLMVLNALHGRALPVYGKGQNIRDWLYVDDHVRALVLIASRGRPGRKYNVGGRNEQRNIDVVIGICALMDELHPAGMPHSQLIRFVADRPGHDERYAIDAGRIECELGWQARENFASGLRKTVRWYIDNEWWWQPLRQQAFGGERLGLLKEVV